MLNTSIRVAPHLYQFTGWLFPPGPMGRLHFLASFVDICDHMTRQTVSQGNAQELLDLPMEISYSVFLYSLSLHFNKEGNVPAKGSEAIGEPQDRREKTGSWN